MALTSTSVIEVNQTALASDSNGGAFDSANAGSTGNDMTYGTYAAVVSGTFSCAGTSTITASSAVFTSSMLGNTINPVGVAGAPWVITAVASSTSATVNTANGTPPTFTNMTGYIGGPLASPGAAMGIHVGGNQIYQSGSFNITSATANVSGGVVLMAVGSSTALTQWTGYGTTRGDGKQSTLIAAAAIAASIISDQGSDGWQKTISNLYVNANSNIGTNSAVYLDGNRGIITNVSAVGSGGYGFGGNGGGGEEHLRQCYSSGNSQGGFSFGFDTYECVAHANGGFGFQGRNGFTISRCLAIGNTGSGFLDGYIGSVFESCTAFGNTTSGFLTANNTWRDSSTINCLSYGNGAYGFNGNTQWVNTFNASGGNTSGNLSATTIESDLVVVTTNPFVNSGAKITDCPSAFAAFALNNTAGGGALCRGAGTPAYLDIGAVQSQSSGSGGIIVPSWTGGFSG